MLRESTFLALLSLVCCASSSSPAETPLHAVSDSKVAVAPADLTPGERLRFAWPNGTARVLLETYVRDHQAPLNATTKLEYVVHVKRETESILVECDGFRVLGVEGTFGGKTWVSPPEGLLGTFRVSNEGEVTEIIDVSKVRQAYLSLAEATRTHGAAAGETSKKLLEATGQTDSLEAAVLNTWISIAGLPAGLDMSVGATDRQEMQAQVPLPGTPTVDLVSEVTLSEGTRCVSKPCVKLRFDTKLAEPNGVLTLVNETLAKVTNENKARATDLVFQSSGMLETSQNTLLPSHLAAEKRVNVTVDTGGKLEKGGRTTGHRMTFEWRI